MTESASENAPVIIVGAGIVGVSTAIWLQRAGIKSILVDRKGPAGGTSYGNAGVLASASVVPVTVPGLIGKAPKMLLDRDQPLFLNWSYLPRLLPWLSRYLAHCKPEEVERIATALAPIVGNSLGDHRALANGTGAEKYISPDDYVYVYQDRAHFESDAFGWQVRERHGFRWDEIEGDSLREFDPLFGTALKFAASVKDHGRISDPGAYVTQLADHITGSSGELVIGDVEQVLFENGRVRGVRVNGRDIQGRATVLASGVWSAELLKTLGYKIPLESERGYHIELVSASHQPRYPSMIASGKFVMTPMDGRVRLAGMVEFGGLVAGPNQRPVEFLHRQLNALVPDMQWDDTREWLGHRPATIDSIPVIGSISGAADLYVGFGHQHVGLTGGPRTGQLLAQLISEGKADTDLSAYRHDRF